jgi:hypothetical protein
MRPVFRTYSKVTHDGRAFGCLDQNCEAEPHKGQSSCSTAADETRFDNASDSGDDVMFEWPAGWEEGRCGPCARATPANGA